jgi:hypothetical protein
MLLPGYANAWSNLGNAMYEAGDKAKGLAGLERSAALYLKIGDRQSYDRVIARLEKLH